MGGQELNFDVETILDLQEMGLTKQEAAQELGISVTTLSNRIAKIQQKQGILLQYRSIQSLQLTELQARILEAITPEKIDSAPLRDLVLAFKVLKDKELNLEGKPSDIKGLVAYLIELEKEDMALKEPVEDAEFEEVKETAKQVTDPDYLPNLEEEM